MKFQQIDHILELIPGQRIIAERTLRAEEEYLEDHFPLFPVMPGVLMLEGLYQTACYLIRQTDNFDHSFLPLLEVRNVKFADFVEPGDTLEIQVEIVKDLGEEVSFKAWGTKRRRNPTLESVSPGAAATTAVAARLTIRRVKLADKKPELAALDRYINLQMKASLERLMAKDLAS